MAQVPYSPVPQVGPSGQNLPTMHPNIPAAAFGASIGEALRGAGQTLEHSGSELFARAVAMQNIQNESEAKEADTRYMIGAGKLHADFSNLEGNQAVNAYPKYQEDLKDLRESIRGSLSSPDAQKRYDSNSLSTMGRSIFNGAGHAATQAKQFAGKTSISRIEALKDQALASPLDDVGFQSGLNLTSQEVRDQGQLHGWSEDTTNQEIARQVSSMWAARIGGLTKTDPIRAKEMYDEAVKKGQLRGEVVGKVGSIVQQGLNTQGSRMISNQVRTGLDLYWGSKPVDIGAAKAAIGGFETGDRYDALGREVFGRDGRSRGRALGRYQVMPENLQPWLKEAGLPAMSEQEFLRSPSAQDTVFSTIFGRYMKETGSFNDAASMWFSGRPMSKAGDAKDALGTTVPDYLKATNAILARNMPLAAKVERGKQLADAISPDDSMLADYTQNRIEADHSRDRRVKLDDEYTNRQTVESALMGSFGDGRLPTTIDELKAAGPETEAAWNQLPPDKQRKYLKVLASNAKGDTAWTTDNLKTYRGLKGLAQEDPAEFLNKEITEESIPNTAKRELINLQIKLKSNAEGDPRVTKALTTLQPMLQSAGITKKADKEGYYQFVGQLQDALSLYQQDNKKAPTAEDVQIIGTRLLQQQAGTGYFGTSVGASQLYNIPVPETERPKIVADFKGKYPNLEPTDEQIRRIYATKLYNDLYGRTKSPTAPRTKANKSILENP